MGHELDFSAGKPAMAYVEAKPWHGLGEELKAGQSIDEWVKAAGLDWEIQMLPVHYFMGDKPLLIRRTATTAPGSSRKLDIAIRR